MVYTSNTVEELQRELEVAKLAREASDKQLVAALNHIDSLKKRVAELDKELSSARQLLICPF